MIETLHDVAAARAAGPPLPAPAEIPKPIATTAAGPVEKRLAQLKDLYDRGLISRQEYEAGRRAILNGL